MTKGIIGSRWIEPGNRVSSYTANGTILTLDDIYESSLNNDYLVDEWVKNKYSPNESKYRLSTANSYSFSAQTTGGRACEMSADGTKLYIARSSTAYQYNLSTPYDITTASFSYSWNTTGEAAVTALYLKNDGTRLFILGTEGDDITWYDLSTAWDLRTATLVSQQSVGTTGLSGFDFSSDGTKLVVSDNNSRLFYIYKLSTAWNPSTIGSFPETIPYGTLTTVDSVSFSSDGRKLYVLDTSLAAEKYMCVYYLTTPYSLANNPQIVERHSMMELVGGGYPANGSTAALSFACFRFTKNNNNCILITASRVYRIPLLASTEFSPFTQTSKFSYLTAATSGQGTYLSSDGNNFYITDSLDDRIYQYTLSTAGDISTANLVSTYSLSTSNIDGNATDIFFKSDGTRLFVLGSDNETIYSYNLGTAWNISTATYTSNFFVGWDETVPTGFCFSSDGTKMYLIGTQNKQIKRYTLRTAWDITTAQFDAYPIYRTKFGSKYAFQFGGVGFLTGTLPTSLARGDFAIESWVYINNYTLDNVIFASDGNLSTDVGTYNFGITATTGTLYFRERTTNLLTSSTSIPLTTWTHVAITRENGTFRLYINGVLSASSTPQEYDFSVRGFYIGSVSTGVNFFNGFMHGLRVVTGNAVYNTSSFPLANTSPILITGTQLLTATQSTFVDESVNLLTLTTGGVSPNTAINQSPWTANVYHSLIANTGYNAYSMNKTTLFFEQYNTTVPYQFREPSNSSVYFGRYTTSPNDFAVSSDGTKFYILDTVTKSILQYSLGTPWTLSTHSYEKYCILSHDELTPSKFTFNTNGTKIYVWGTARNRITEYTLSVAWDVGTATPSTRTLPINPQYTVSQTSAESAYSDIFFNNDGTKMYLLGQFLDAIWEYDLTIPYNPTSASRTITSTNSSVTTPQGFFVNYNGGGNKLIFVQGGATGAGSLYQYTLITANNLSTMYYDNVATTVSASIGLKDFTMNNTGDKLYTLRQVAPTSLSTYDVELPWNIGKLTANNNSITLTSLETVPSGVYFKEDGNNVYIIGQTNDRVIDFKLTESWNVATAYCDIITPQDTSCPDLSFSSDGLNVYTIGQGNDRLYQYTLTKPWELGTAKYDSKFTSVGLTDTSVTALFFAPNGANVYTCGTASDRVGQYTLSTPWDVTTATLANTRSILTQDTTSSALFFSTDGTKMYMVGQTSDAVYQYTLTNPWEIGTATYASKSFSVLAQDTNMEGIFFKSDGTKMYLVGSTSDAIYEYTLGTAWDISTTSLTTSRTLASIGSSQTACTGLFFSSDGLNLYLSGNTPLSVQHFRLRVAWDISTIRWDLFSVLTQTTAATGLEFSNTGHKMYTTAAGVIYEYNLANNWLVGTSSYNTALNTVAATGENASTTIRFNKTGTEMYFTGTTRDYIITYTLSTPWDITTARLNNSPRSFNVAVYDTTATGLDFKPDGSGFIVVGSANNRIHNFSLANSWNIQTASLISSTTIPSGITAVQGCVWSNTGNTIIINTATQVATLELDSPYNTANLYGPRFSVVTQDGGTTDLRFSTDGTKMYLTGPTTSAKILQYNLATPWRVSSATYFNQVAIAQDTSPQGLDFSTDGTSMYVLGITSDTVYQYTMSTPWDITTATYASKSLLVSGADLTGGGIQFNSTGTIMYMIGTTSRTFRQYALSTAWDISTGSLSSNTFSISAIETAPNALFVRPDGSTMYFVGSTQDRVYQYSFGQTGNVASLSAVTSVSIVNQEATTSGLHFSSDGIFMYISGATSDFVHQYRLRTAWDVSTAEYYLTSLSQDTSMTGIRFANNGLTMYSVGSTGDNIYQYSLGLPFNTNNVTYITGKSISFVEGGVTGFFYESNSNTFYTVGTSTPYRVGKFVCLSSNANVSTIASSDLSVGTTPVSITTNSTDNKLFVYRSTGVVEGFTYQSNTTGTGITADTLTTASANGNKISIAPSNSSLYLSTNEGDILTYQFTSPNTLTGALIPNQLTITTQENTPTAVELSSDGSKIYVLGSANDRIYQLTTNTNYDFTSATQTQSFDYNVYGISFNGTSDVITSASSTNFDIFGVDFTVRFSFKVNSYTNSSQYLIQVGNSFTNRAALFLNSSNKNLVITSVASGSTTAYAVPLHITTDVWYHVAWQKDGIYINGTKYTVTGVSYPSGLTNVVSLGFENFTGTSVNYLNGFIFNLEILKGQNFYSSNFVVGDTYGWYNDKIYTKTANTVFLVGQSTSNSTTILDTSNTLISLTGNTTNTLKMFGGVPTALRFNSSGNKMYVLDSQSDLVIQYDLTESWNVATASISYASDSYARLYSSDAMRESSPGGIHFSKDGTKVYVVGTGGSWRVYQFELGTPYDLSTILNSSKKFDIYQQIKQASGIKFNDVGTIMYVCGVDANTSVGIVYSYNLSEAWNIQTATVNQSLSVNTYETNPTDIEIRNNGKALYILGTQGDDLTEYFLPTAWVLSGAQYINTYKLYSTVTSTASTLQQISSPQSMQFMENGNYLYVVGSTTSNNTFDVLQHRSLNTTYRPGSGDGITTVGLDKNIEVGNVSGIYITENSSKLWAVDSTNARIYEYNGR